MKKENYTILLLIITIVMLVMVLLIASHYKNDLRETNKKIKELEIIIKKDTTVWRKNL
jgi:cell division protein FtsL